MKNYHIQINNKDSHRHNYNISISQNNNKSQNNVKNLLITGNGLDLSLGLDSSFIDFFHIYHKLYMNICSFKNGCREFDKKYIDKSINSLDVLRYINCLKIQELSPETNLKLLRHDGDHDINDIEHTQSLNDAVATFFGTYNKEDTFYSGDNFNFWAMYFLLRKDEGLPDWYNVEDEIQNFLMNSNEYLYDIYLNLSQYLEIQTPTVKRGKSRISMHYSVSESVHHLWDLDLIVNIFIYALLTRSSINCSKNSFANNFTVEKINNFTQFKQLFIKFLKSQLRLFEYSLNDYLMKCLIKYNKKYGFSYYSIGGLFLKELNKGKNFSLLNFNYTNPTKNISNITKFKRNIHGILNKEHNTRISPIIGINNTNNISIDIDNPMYQFTKNYRIMRLSCNNYNNILRNSVNKIEFFGHSFDAQDRVYFYEIFHKYHIENGKTKLIFYYKPYGKQDDYTGAINQINEAMELFKGYFSNNSKDTSKFMSRLSLDGQLVISNVNDIIIRDSILNKKFNWIDNIQNLVLTIDNSKINDTNNTLKDIKNSLKYIKNIINDDVNKSIASKYELILSYMRKCDSKNKNPRSEMKDIINGFNKFVKIK